jgi:hypothetical protein
MLRSLMSSEQPPAQSPVAVGGGPVQQAQTVATRALPVFAGAVAVALLVAYFILLLMQMNKVHEDEPAWSRRSDLFRGVEALAFSAAGAILGTTVQRQVTKKAEAQEEQARKDADEQRQRANENAAAAEKGRALQRLAMVKAQGAGSGPQVRGGPGTAHRSEFQELVELAERYDTKS